MMFQILAAPSAGLQIGAMILGLAIAIILHEVAHGYVALQLGDPTAKYAGRLTLNPIKHIDLWGTILIPLFLMISTGMMFGWAKPVPVNYFNLRGGKYGPLWVALAGPLMNFILLAVFAIAARLSPEATALPALFVTVAFVNGLLMLFNLIPVPPLDGSKVLYLFLDGRPEVVHFLERYGMIILFAIIILGGGLLGRIVFEPTLGLVSFFSGFSVLDIFNVIR